MKKKEKVGEADVGSHDSTIITVEETVKGAVDQAILDKGVATPESK